MEDLVLQSEIRSECARSPRPEDESLRQWVKTEHHRLHCAEGWPDTPYKKQCSPRPVPCWSAWRRQRSSPLIRWFAWFVPRGEIR